MKRIYLMIIPAMMAVSCHTATETDIIPALDPEAMDLSVKPGDDFFKYANGGWMAAHPLTAEYARYGMFEALAEQNEKDLNALFQSMAEMTPEKGSADQKIVDLYKQGLDSTRLNAEGGSPIKKYVDQIYALQSKESVVRTVAGMHDYGDGCFFGAGVSTDMVDCENQILYFGQTGLGMRNRDYYLEESNAALKKGYTDMLARMLTLTGVGDAEQAAANAVEFETALARICWTNVQNRDVQAQYNPMSTAELAKKYSGFDFISYLEARGVAPQEKVIVEQPSFFEGFSKLFEKTDLAVLKDYLACCMVRGAANSLSDEYYNASFDFFSRQMSGITEPKPRWKRAMAVPNGILGEAVGKMYVEKYFPEENKAKMLEIVGNLKTALGLHIDALEWMGDETKAYAREKLAGFTVKIGYPDKWKDYSALEIDPALSYYENLRAASRWLEKENMDKLGTAPDRSEWGMSPQTVNAYYNPTTNEICFPAAILQPPFFNINADDAVNYGAIGVVIGHEMTHGFDDQGRLFDKVGNMKSWWTEADDAAFKEKAEVLVDQFNKVEIRPGLMADGRFTLGENIADQGGLSIAHSALEIVLDGKVPEKIDGFTADQRFFLGFARVWAGNFTEEEIARRTKVDEHSLSFNRVNVSLRNFQLFFDAFGIKEGDPMWRPESERVMIW